MNLKSAVSEFKVSSQGFHASSQQMKSAVSDFFQIFSESSQQSEWRSPQSVISKLKSAYIPVCTVAKWRSISEWLFNNFLLPLATVKSFTSSQSLILTSFRSLRRAWIAFLSPSPAAPVNLAVGDDMAASNIASRYKLTFCHCQWCQLDFFANLLELNKYYDNHLQSRCNHVVPKYSIPWQHSVRTWEQQLAKSRLCRNSFMTS